MAVEFKLPELGENVVSGTISRVLVTPGDVVEKDQPILEIETDKAVVEVPVIQSGRVVNILVKEGEIVKVGQTILVLEEKSVTSVAPPVESPAVKTEQKAVEEVAMIEQKVPTASTTKKMSRIFTIPELGENIHSGTVSKILVSERDTLKKGQSVIELETEKAVVELPIDFAGVVRNILVKEGEVVKVGQNLIEVEVEADWSIPETVADEAGRKTQGVQADIRPSAREAEKVEPVSGFQTPLPAGVPPSGEPVPAAPSIRRFAREIGIDIHQVPGTGVAGRITIEDVKNYARTLHRQKAVPSTMIPGIEAEELPDFSRWGEIERQPMSKVREKTARHLSYAWATIPHVTQFDKTDITDLEQLRQRYGKQVEAAGGKLTITVILLKIVAYALKKYPQFNASIDLQKSEIIYKKYVNIGVAVDTDRGLLVPVIREVDKKNIVQLSKELSELAQKARDRKLTLAEMQGGNFSISNLGGIGGSGFTPVVNSPEVAILGVSRSEIQQVFREGEFKARLILPLSLSYDHRLIDGADAARFLRWIAEALENPFKILLEL